MGWFDEQIKERRQYDDDAFSEAFANMASAVMGKRFEAAFTSDRAVTKDAIDEILKYYHVKSREVPDSIKDVNEQLEFLMRPYGIMRRTVKLEDGWYRDAVGAMLGTLSESGRVVALIPSGLSGYSFFDYETGKARRITRKNQHLFDDEAIAFYKPFPLKKLSIASLSAYIVQTLSVSDFVLIALATLAVSLVGLLSPMLSRLLFDRVLPSGNTRILLALAAFTVCVSVSTLLLSAVKSMLTARIETKLNLSVEAATMMRVMSLPADFFKQYSAGELSSRAAQVGPLCRMLVSTVLSTGLTSLFSLIYISQIFAYAPTLVAPALAILLVTVVFSVVSSLAQMKISTEQMTLSGRESGMTYALITGIQKIKLAGAEKRAFARWGNLYAQSAKMTYDPPMFLKLNSVISLAISLTGTLVMYYMSVRAGLSVADYYAFNTAYGMVSGAFLSLAGIALSAAQIRPILTMVQPFFDAVPEVSDGKQVIDFNNANGLAAAEAIRAFCNDPAFVTGDDSVLAGGIGDAIACGVSGTWVASAIQEKLGDNYGCCKLPTFTCDGKQVQMGSFLGCKIYGVNSQTAYPVDSMELAEYLTSEKAQIERYNVLNYGPSNVNALADDTIASNLALQALNAQSEFAVSQMVLGGFWTPAEAFGAELEAHSTGDLQTMLDQLVEQALAG